MPSMEEWLPDGPVFFGIDRSVDPARLTRKVSRWERLLAWIRR